MRQEPKSVFFIVIAALLWSTGGLLIKYIPLSSMALSAIRSLIGLIVIVAFNFRTKLVINKTVLLSAFCLAYTLTGFVIANRYTSAASAIILQYCSPICIALYSFFLYKKKPSKHELIALSGAFIGILLFFFGKFSGSSLFGNILALSTGFAFGGMFFINNKKDCDTYSALVIGQAITVLIGIPFLWGEDFSLSPTSIFSILFIGIFQVGVAYVCFAKGIKHVSPLKANIICMIEPIISPMWVFIFLGETLTINAMIGSVVVIGSVIYLNISKVAERSS